MISPRLKIGVEEQKGLIRVPGSRGGWGAYFLDGKKCSGVTTATSVIDKPALKKWAAEMGANYIAAALAEYVEQGKPVPPEVLKQVCLDSIEAHKQRSAEAKSVGSAADLWISEYVRRKIGNVKGELELPDKEKHPAARSSVDAFLEWEMSVDVEWLGVQHAAADPRYLIVGVADLWAALKGRLWVLDIKSSKVPKAPYPEWELQISANLTVAALGRALRGIEVEFDKDGELTRLGDVGRAILVTPKEGGTPVFMEVTSDRQYDWESVLRAAGLRQRIPQQW